MFSEDLNIIMDEFLTLWWCFGDYANFPAIKLMSSKYLSKFSQKQITEP